MKGGHAHAVLGLISVLGSCARGETFAPIPPLPPATESVLLIELGDRTRIEAMPVAALAAPIHRSTDGLRELLLFAYPERLEDLRIQPGEVTIASPESCAAMRLPETETMLSLRLEDPSAGFLALSTPSPEVEGLQVEIRCPCVPLTEEHRFMGALGDGLFITVRPSARLVVVAERGVVEASASLELLGSSTTTDTFTGAYVAADGAIRITGKRGRLYRWIEGTGIQVMSVADPPTDLAAIGGSPPGSPDETLVAAEGAGLYALSAGALTSLPRAPPTGNTSQWANVLWRGPGRFLVSLRSGEGLEEIIASNGTWTARSQPWPSLVDPILRLAQIEPYGVVLTTRTVRLFHRVDDDTDWIEIIPSTITRESFHSLLPFRGGMLLGYSSVLMQHHPESGFCPPTTLSETFISDSLLEHQGAIYATGNQNATEDTPIYRFVPRDPG